VFICVHLWFLYSVAASPRCSTNLFYRAVLARFRAAIFLARFRARSCEAFAPLGFSLSGDHWITGAPSRNERFGFVISDFIWV
jgi:hypothetical protein